jgi:rRNA maturation RNase YbeY
MNSRSSARSAVRPGIRNSAKVKDAILGSEYELSLVICGNALSHKLNKQYRGKDKPTNVLAFPLSETSGEIFINKMHLDGFSMLELLIHGLLHLKGMEHGAKMESEEKRYLKLFNNGARSLSGDRHRKSDR